MAAIWNGYPGHIFTSENQGKVAEACITGSRRLSDWRDSPPEEMGVTHEYHLCIDACNVCASACEEGMVDCQIEGGATSTTLLTRCIARTIDCAEICHLAASFLARHIEVSEDICDACAKVCDDCA